MIDHAGTPGETMRTVHIRAVTTTDASAIAALNVAVQTLHWTAHPTQFKPAEPEAFERTLQDLLARDEAFRFIAENDEEGAIGYVLAVRRCRVETSLTSGIEILEVDQIAVLPACPTSGVGRALVAEVFNLAGQVGASRGNSASGI